MKAADFHLLATNGEAVSGSLSRVLQLRTSRFVSFSQPWISLSEGSGEDIDFLIQMHTVHSRTQEERRHLNSMM